MRVNLLCVVLVCCAYCFGGGACLWTAAVPEAVDARENPEASEVDEGALFDRPVRYVNQKLITLQDVQQRVQEDLQLAGRTRMPENSAEVLKLREDALLQLTYEELILQEAKRLGLTISLKMISADVRTRMEQSGHPPNLEVLSEMAKRQMRNTKIQVVIRHYLEMAPSICPCDIEVYYQKNIHQYRRPARWHLYQIVLAPADKVQKERVFNGMLDVYRKVKGSQQPLIQALLDEEKSLEFTAMPFAGDQQVVFLSDLCKQVHELEIEDAGSLSASLQTQAQCWHTAAAQLRDKQQITAMLEAVGAEIDAIAIGEGADLDADGLEKRLELFKTKANALSMGLGAGKGGDLKLIEMGSQNAAIQDALKTLQVAVTSDVIWFHNSAYLLFVTEKEEAVQRGFSEVSGEILKILEKRQRAAVKLDIEKQLYTAASITNVGRNRR